MPLNRYAKVGVLEIDGEELDQPSEYKLEASDILYDAVDPNGPNLYDKITSTIIFLYVLNSDLILENNESKVVANKIDCNNNNIRLKGNSILRIS